MSCYKCHFRGKSADFQSETADFRFKSYLLQSSSYFFNSIFFLLLTFFTLNRNSFTFGSYTLVTVRPNQTFSWSLWAKPNSRSLAEQFDWTKRLVGHYVTGILIYSYPFLFWNTLIILVLLRLAWLFGCEGCSGQQWWWRKEAKNETFLSIFWCFFFHLSRHQRDHINLNTFWQCTARFTSGENQLISGQKQLTSGHRRVVEEHMSSHFSFCFFIWNCFTFCLN